MRVIADNGDQLGVLSRQEALDRAAEAGLDLVEVAPNAEPPVAKIMDYGKHLYQKDKANAVARKKQKQIQIKEMKFRPNTDTGDYAIKLKRLVSFLEGGDKIKVTLRFRGREVVHQHLGLELMDRIKADLDELAVVEAAPRPQGRLMTMVMAPRAKKA